MVSGFDEMAGKTDNSCGLSPSTGRGGTADATDLKSVGCIGYGRLSDNNLGAKSERAESAPRSATAWTERDNRPADFSRQCRTCGTAFTPTARVVARGGGWYCSRSCASKTTRPHPFFTPESTPAERVRANGLVNKRLKLGWQQRPTTCQKCGRECKPDSHHPDYGKPDEVLWLCRSCHMKAHSDPTTIAGLQPVAVEKITALLESERKGGGR